MHSGRLVSGSYFVFLVCFAMPTYSCSAIILKRLDFGEADRILTLYTKHRGKIKAIAKSVRKPTSRKGGNLELFNHCRLSIAEGKSLDIITEAEAVETFPEIRKDIETIGRAFCVAELLDRLTPEREPHPDIFELTLQTYRNLSPAALRRYAKTILTILGFWNEDLEREESLQQYIESIIERRLNSPDFLKSL